ncbi:MAG: hypothetical protein KKI12_00685 [Proteobacteria bacterium]|nr:hypothetical protein [Pseudomonadota bacterium]MBU4286673.1 hypothetical protein [Pseudomonadota bacterium]MBU4415055.1 hypothetical protein [Pseudomonadota bacterium]MCG2759212.1 hypothetical protein [Desulfobacteraceae bacterium]
MQITAKIIITILIIAIQIGGIYAMVRVWKSDLDIPKMIAKPFSFVETKKPFTPPSPNFKIVTMPSNYSAGLEVYDVVWADDYCLYRFEITNSIGRVAIQDVRIELEIPGGFVAKKVINQAGVDGLSFSEDKMPAGIAKGPGMGKLVSTFPYYSNRLTIGISKLNSQAILDIDFVVKVVGGKNDGVFSIRYSFIDPQGTLKTERHLHPLVKEETSNSIKINTDVEITGSYQRSIAIIPDKPIIFKGNGSVEIKDK